MPFISIEGCDGSGKTTQANLLQQYLKSQGLNVFLTKEPGGSKLGEIIREILLSNEIEDTLTEFLLLSAARRDHILEIKKCLAQEQWVITDRFSDSSLAYQGYAKGLSIQQIELITSMITDSLMPDLTIVLDVSIDVMESRIKNSPKHMNFYDLKGIDFHRKVKDGFLQIAEDNKNRIVIVNADDALEVVSDKVIQLVRSRFVL